MSEGVEGGGKFVEQGSALFDQVLGGALREAQDAGQFGDEAAAGDSVVGPAAHSRRVLVGAGCRLAPFPGLVDEPCPGCHFGGDDLVAFCHRIKNCTHGVGERSREPVRVEWVEIQHGQGIRRHGSIRPSGGGLDACHDFTQHPTTDIRRKSSRSR